MVRHRFYNTLSQMRVLEFASRHAEGVTQKTIEEHFQVSHPTIVGSEGTLACL